MSTEYWKDVPGYEGIYMASYSGKVKCIIRTKGHRIREVIPQSDGKYLQVCLYKNGAKRFVKLHRIIANTFCFQRPGADEVNHVDGNKHNNCAFNLEWVTGAENREHAVRTGLTPRGSRIANSKLTREDIIQIRRRLANKETLQTLADEYGVCFQNISNIKRGLSWAWVKEVA